MYVEISKITIENFRTFRDPQSVDFHALGRGVTYVRGVNKYEPALGSNGAAKSSIWDALQWCLFGRTTHGLRGLDIRPWRTKLHPHVTCLVYVGDALDAAKLYKIERSTKTNGLWIDGKVVDQRAIDMLLGMTLATFENAVLLGQGQPLFLDMRAGDKLAMLSDALALDRWADRSKAAGRLTQTARQNVAEVRAALRAAEDVLRKTADAIADLKNKSSAWEHLQHESKSKRQSEITRLEKLLANAQNVLGTADLAYDGAETELRNSRAKLNDANTKLAQLSRDKDRAAADQRTALRDYNVLKDAAPKKGSRCPTCGAAIDNADFAKHKREHDAKVEDARLDLRDAEDVLAKADRALKQQQGVVDAHAKDVRDFTDKSNDAIDKRTSAQTRVAEYKAEITAHQRITEQSGTNPYDELLADARKTKRQFEQDIADGEAGLIEGDRRVAACEYWVDGFKAVRLYLLEETLDELQAVTNSLLPAIGLHGWQVNYAMERETKAGDTSIGLNVTVLSPANDDAVRWEVWSGGEGQRVRIAASVALSEVLLRRAGVECDLLVLDEPTRHMSPEGIADVGDFLVERGRDQQVLYVDHAAVENARFRNRITVTKDRDGVSSIATRMF